MQQDLLAQSQHSATPTTIIMCILLLLRTLIELQFLMRNEIYEAHSSAAGRICDWRVEQTKIFLYLYCWLARIMLLMVRTLVKWLGNWSGYPMGRIRRTLNSCDLANESETGIFKLVLVDAKSTTQFFVVWIGLALVPTFWFACDLRYDETNNKIRWIVREQQQTTRRFLALFLIRQQRAAETAVLLCIHKINNTRNEKHNKELE